MFLSVLVQEPNRIAKNGMELEWHFAQELIWFEMSAPTEGWVAIGFNESQTISGNYLLMGRVQNGKSEVVEHATIAPGKYHKIEDLDGSNQILSVSGKEIMGKTTLKFALPINALGPYRKDLKPANEYILLLAYSRDDDFQHHSMMRTSIKIKL